MSSTAIHNFKLVKVIVDVRFWRLKSLLVLKELRFDRLKSLKSYRKRTAAYTAMKKQQWIP